MSTLINPANGQRCEFVRAERGYIALDTTQVTRAIRWFSEAAIAAVNPVATCALPPFMTEYVNTCEPPPLVVATPNIVIELTPDLAANVNASAGVVIKVVQPVTVWHPAMKEAA